MGDAAGDGGPALVRRLAERAGTLLLLPLSMVPFVLLGPQIAESHRNFQRSQDASALPAPRVVPTALEAALWQPPLRARGAGVPVLAYAGVGGERPAVTRLAF